MNIVFNGMAWGFEHVAFDAALLASVASAFPDEGITFFGEREHVDQVQRFLTPRAPGIPVRWREIVIPPRLAPPRNRLARDVRICRDMLTQAKKLGASRVIACYVHSVTGTIALKALNRLPHVGQIALIHHGSIQRLLASRRYHPVLSFANSGLRQIVLGDSIRVEVIARSPRIRDVLHAIRLPYFFEQSVVSQLPASGPLTFSFLGLVDDMKGFPEFVDLAERVVAVSGAAARFDLIGGTREGNLPYSPGRAVVTYSQDGPMPRVLYEAKLCEISYAVFPYNPSYYRFVASASVLDALSAGKPIIALRNSQFEEMFAAMGNIGYLCDSMADMAALIANIVREPPRERYDQQSSNILAKRAIYSTDAVGRQLRRVLAPVAST